MSIFRGLFVIDLFPLKQPEVLQRFPAVNRHVVDTVKPERGLNREPFRKEIGIG